jgi:hypothetical protein
MNGATIKEAAAEAGVSYKRAEQVLADEKAKAEVARRFANVQDAKSYCHRRLYERIGQLLDHDEKWPQGAEMFGRHAKIDSEIMATLAPAAPQAWPGLAIQVNTGGAPQQPPVTLDELAAAAVKEELPVIDAEKVEPDGDH